MTPTRNVAGTIRRLLTLLILAFTVAGGCKSDDDSDPPPELRPGVYEIRIRFIDIQGSSRCFDAGGFITRDTICVSAEILDFASIEDCPFTPDDEDGHFDCLANALWNECPSEIQFDGQLDVVDPENFLLFGIYQVEPLESEACRSNCRTRVSFEGKWLHSGGCP